METGLIEIPIGGRLFTWMNKAGTKLSKLDRFLMSEDVLVTNPDLKAIVLDRLWSDHNPILLHADKTDFEPIPLGYLHPYTSASNDVEGDENTKFFHDIIKLKRRNQTVQGVLVNGEWYSNPNHVKEAFYNFYQEKFQAQEAQFNATHNPGFTSLHQDDANDLQRTPSSEEIRNVVWACGSDKSPGPDGFSFLFLKKYWDYFKGDVEKFALDFMKTDSLPRGTNSAFITLIPKVPNLLLMKDYRLISLIGMQYKIIAKLLAIRLAKVLDNIVSPVQSAFISGRQILDGPWYVFNYTYLLPLKKNKKLMIFKVDFEKAFDSVNWNYLDFGLLHIGFSEVNGDPGCCAWRNSYGLCFMEGLHLALQEANHSRLIKGVSLGNDAFNVSYFFFADDVVILTDQNTNDMENIVRTLNSFYMASGLKINIAKSNVYGVGVSQENLEAMATLTGCLAGSLPFTYLGLPIGKNMKLTDSWCVMVDKFKSKLSSWKANLLSIGGRLTLIKSILLGGHDDHHNMAWVKWENILAPLDQGGLGVGSLKAFNLALLQKWRWRLVNKPDLLWVRIIKVVHGMEAGLDEKGCYTKGIWAQIVGSSNYLHSCNILAKDQSDLLHILMRELRHVALSANSDSWTWSVGEDEVFSVAATRLHIDHSILPSSTIET
ncbi:putative RNA-directed DNA polymerase, eukaryota, reverse transcriptase zinc-binding domain protein, partial [Tanacetum coccineum]